VGERSRLAKGLAERLRREMEKKKITKSVLAKRMATSRSQLDPEN
jgi:hypothetical protein